MDKYNVTGMSCAACSARVEKAVLNVEGVTFCSVNLLTNTLTVDGNVSTDKIKKAVEDAGYGVDLNDTGEILDDKLKDRETPALKKRLYWSLAFLLILMYISMGHTMWNFPLPSKIAENHILQGILQFVLSLTVIVINKKFFVNGFSSLLKKSPNMDTLVALGSGASFVYSTYALGAMIYEQSVGNHHQAVAYMHEFYFESAAMILALITVGKMLEAYSKGKTTDAIKGLMKLTPKKAVVERDGVLVTIDADQIQIGDIFIVKPGESIPADGIVTEGTTSIDESSLSGESIPVDKGEGDNVSAATVNQNGFIKCRATRVGKDTAISKIIELVNTASSSKAPIAKTADKVSGVFVPVVISVSAITILLWLAFGETFGFALARGISVLVISCPCALGLATPVAIMVGNGVGAKNGILFKTATSLEETGRVDTVVLDKTGTITKGEPEVTDISPFEDTHEDILMQTAYSIEIKSEHPLAKAVVKKAEGLGIKPLETTDFHAETGSGLTAVMDGEKVVAGNLKFVSLYVDISDNAMSMANDFALEGKTPLFFAKGEKLIGIIAVADTLKEDSPQAIKELQEMGLNVVMLTGDNNSTAQAIGKQAGVDVIISEVLPAEKEQEIQKLRSQGKVIMVGDGINDAPALTRADVGIAIGVGTEIAVDAADVVLMNSTLKDVPAAIRLSRATLKNIHENLFWAFIYNVIGIPLAAGVFIPLFDLRLNPMIGAAAMSLSSFCVVTNALRLNGAQIKNPKKYKKIIKKGEKNVKKVLKIEGMMCPHCEARVKKTLEEIEAVTSATVSHETGTAEVELTREIDENILKNAVENQGYKVLD